MIKQKLFFLPILSILILILGCSTNKKSQKKSLDLDKILKSSAKKYPLSFLYQADTLTLTARFCECGEFGGHKEKIKVFSNYKSEYFVKYIKDSIDINCPNDFDKNAVIIKDTLFKIDVYKQKQIVKYLDKLYKKTVNNYSLSSSNEYFEASTKHNVLKLFTAEPENKWNEFRKLQILLVK